MMRPFRPGSTTHDKQLVLQHDDDDDEDELQVRIDVEQRAARQIGQALNGQRRQLMDRLRESSDPADWFRQEFEQMMGSLRFDRKQQDALSRTLIDAADLGVRIAAEQLEGIGFGFDWTLTNTEAWEWAEQYAGQLIAGIDRTTVERTRQAVGRWVLNGEPLARLAEDLTPIYGPLRAEMIAATEVTRAFAEGNKRAYRESGVVSMVEWRTARDERVCPICGPLHGQQLAMDTDWRGFLPDTVQLSRGFHLPPAHVRCRCWIVPVIEEMS